MSFIHFGCWNKGYCKIDFPGEETKDSEEASDVSKVMSHIKTKLTEDDTINFLVVCGDNYYPVKNKDLGIKYFNESEFLSGFKCLGDFNKQIYLLMGNHDLKKEENLYDTLSNDRLDKCTIINKQIALLSEYPKIDIKTKVKKINDFTLGIFLTSTIFFDADYSCADKILTKPYHTYEMLTIFSQIIKHLNSMPNLQNFIIFGHEPIISIRKKKGSLKTFAMNEIGNSFITEIYNILDIFGISSDDGTTKINKYYLCADTHQYQQTEIIINGHTIQQYVVGTGGASCDKDVLDSIVGKTNILSDIVYTLKNYIVSHGYLICKYENSNLEFNFIKTHECSNKTTKKGGVFEYNLTKLLSG